jgi:hypothetical protein
MLSHMDSFAQRTTEVHAGSNEPLLAPSDVAKRLGLEETTLAAWRCSGRPALPYVRIGGRIRYRPCDVASFIADNLQPAREGGSFGALPIDGAFNAFSVVA